VAALAQRRVVVSTKICMPGQRMSVAAERTTVELVVVQAPVLQLLGVHIDVGRARASNHDRRLSPLALRRLTV
jgi:hypothetical protein